MDLKRFRKLLDRQWAIESLGSLALTDLAEKTSTKPKFLPITEDNMRLKKIVEKKGKLAKIKKKITNRCNSQTCQSEVTQSLTRSEVMLTKSYIEQRKYFEMLSRLRSNAAWFNSKNKYLFTYPHSLPLRL